MCTCIRSWIRKRICICICCRCHCLILYTLLLLLLLWYIRASATAIRVVVCVPSDYYYYYYDYYYYFVVDCCNIIPHRGVVTTVLPPMDRVLLLVLPSTFVPPLPIFELFLCSTPGHSYCCRGWWCWWIWLYNNGRVKIRRWMAYNCNTAPLLFSLSFLFGSIQIICNSRSS